MDKIRPLYIHSQSLQESLDSKLKQKAQKEEELRARETKFLTTKPSLQNCTDLVRNS